MFCENSIKLTFDATTHSTAVNIQKEIEELANKRGFNLGVCKIIPADKFNYHLSRATWVILNTQRLDHKMKKMATDILKTCQNGTRILTTVPLDKEANEQPNQAIGRGNVKEISSIFSHVTKISGTLCQHTDCNREHISQESNRSCLKKTMDFYIQTVSRDKLNSYLKKKYISPKYHMAPERGILHSLLKSENDEPICFFNDDKKNPWKKYEVQALCQYLLENGITIPKPEEIDRL